jgi:hypothetical protein
MRFTRLDEREETPIARIKSREEINAREVEEEEREGVEGM